MLLHAQNRVSEARDDAWRLLDGSKKHARTCFWLA